MIALDKQKYYDIMDSYFDLVYASLKRSMNSDSYAPAMNNEPKGIRKLVYKLYEFDLMPCLIDASNDPLGLLTANKDMADQLPEDNLRAAVRALVLADIRRLRDAAEKLYPSGGSTFSKELEEYNRLRGKRDKDDAEKQKETQLGQTYEFLTMYADRAYANMRNQKIRRKDTSVSLPEYLVEALGIRTCPYCNRGYIGLTKGRLIGVELDHFFNRSKYPFFAVSLFNLVPSCGVCNNVKRDAVSDMVSPFEDDMNFDALRFTYEIPRTAASGTAGAKRRLKIDNLERDPDKKKRFKANIDVFRLEEVYLFQEREAEKFYEKMLAYPKSRLEEIVEHFNRNSHQEPITVDSLEEALFLEYFTEPYDYTQKPMAKFYRDLYFEIRGWK